MDSKTELYGYKVLFRGRQIVGECEPPVNLIEVFIDLITSQLTHPGWDNKLKDRKRHYCDENCAFETYIIMGRPYCASLRVALER